jgi:3-(3-hydroxy-phenyl)propionate hydroxylase
MQVSFSNGRYSLPEYPFRVPPELSEPTRRRHPVVIVGAGLVGLTTACALAQLGVPVVVLDEDDTVGVRGVSSRGVCYARKSLEIFDRLGIYRRMLGKGVCWTVGRTFDGERQVFEFDLATDASSRQPPFINLQQFYVEAFLIERAAELATVDLRWRNKVVGGETDAHGATLSIETPAGEYSLLADWVVDCSGARGGLAESLGLRRRGTRTDDRWCIADIIFDEPLPVERHTWVTAGFNDGRAVWRHALADHVWRLDYQLDPGDPRDAADEAAVRERLRRQAGRDVACRIVWTGTWSYRSECLETFRRDRVLFAGDCAHTMSPFGGRGGNSGIQDADNLAWKLAWVIAGKADASLLDTYAHERRAAALENIRIAERTGRFLRPANPAENLYRDATLALARRHAFARSLVNTGRMSQPNVYADSRLNVGRGAGRPMPNLPLTLPDGREGDVVQLMKWAAGDLVLLVDTETPDLTALESRFPVRIVGGARLDGYSADPLILLRPDLYCAGTFARGDVAALEHALEVFTCPSTMTTTKSS